MSFDPITLENKAYYHLLIQKFLWDAIELLSIGFYFYFFDKFTFSSDQTFEARSSGSNQLHQI